MNTPSKISNYLIASIWLVNGLLFKIFNLVPRHQEIVAEILGSSHSTEITFAIGVSEILMTFWVLSNYKAKINAILQILIIMTMNIIEFILVPELLLWGKFNLLFASIFSLFIYLSYFKTTFFKLKFNDQIS
ncbi:DoxX-like family protein [Sediminibacter sp. Hel_I_10]|uniref:DoxX-like family protein n=1 Tax=Sediminibacter sp. Hel_I_10 TaxID=1392490 RepID=UPI000569F699|nr:DoxX-like family protein [Sediminibacter sp. Hel_I_10]